MEAWIEGLIAGVSLPVIFLIIAACIYVLGKGADILVAEAVTLSVRWGVPKLMIGATIVSLGTTLPEATVSVLAAVRGYPGLALGNAVGSVICDTGLILGIACVLQPLPLDRFVVNRQGWIQLGAGFLLVLACFPYGSPESVWSQGGRLPRLVGVLFLGLLVVYLVLSIRWSRRANGGVSAMDTVHEDSTGAGVVLLKLAGGIVLVILASKVLIPTVTETALRLKIPDSIIAATVVAFGTSLPELVTALTAVRRGHGELAVGNVIGADILNVLFVAGAAAAVTSGGLAAPPQFFRMLFPAMLFDLIVFRLGIVFSGDRLKRPFGVVLLIAYLAITIISYIYHGAPAGHPH